MKLRDLFHAFRHPERESRCHELNDEEREAAALRVEEMLARRLTAADLRPAGQAFGDSTSSASPAVHSDPSERLVASAPAGYPAPAGHPAPASGPKASS